MVNQVMLLAISMFVFALVILWISVKNMISRKSIYSFLPFFLLGFILSFYGSVIIFELFFDVIWMIFESMVFVVLLWIFINIWRESLW